MTSRDRKRYDRGRALGQKQAGDRSAVIRVRYDESRDLVDLTFRGGGSMAVPRKLIPALERAPAVILGGIELSPAGDALSWPSLDVDVYIPGLIERAFGSRLFAAASGQRGGRIRSKAKAAAAKINGAKGGRPRGTAGKRKAHASPDQESKEDALARLRRLRRPLSPGLAPNRDEANDG